MSVVAVTVLLTACNGSGEPVPTTAEPPEPAITIAAENTAEDNTEAQSITDNLIDFALIDRLFSMTLADFFREEGKEKQPEEIFEGGPYYSFNKYDPESYFFFGGSDDRPSAMALEAHDLLVDYTICSLGEMKQWLDRNKIEYHTYTDEDGGFGCAFIVSGYTCHAYTENESDSNDAIVRRFFVKPKD